MPPKTAIECVLRVWECETARVGRNTEHASSQLLQGGSKSSVFPWRTRRLSYLQVVTFSSLKIAGFRGKVPTFNMKAPLWIYLVVCLSFFIFKKAHGLPEWHRSPCNGAWFNWNLPRSGFFQTSHVPTYTHYIPWLGCGLLERLWDCPLADFHFSIFAEPILLDEILVL